MRIAFIFNPFKYKVHEENLKIVQKYFGMFPPLSLAWAASIAREAGHQVTLIDARTLNLTKDQTLEKLKAFNPDIMGFMMTTYMFNDTLAWIKYMKSHLKIPVIVGGYNLRIYPKESLSHPDIDFGIFDQALYTLPGLLKALETKTSFTDVPGLIFKNGDKVTVNPSIPVDFNDFPSPARDLLPNELYAEFPTERKNFTIMVTSLGCPHNCKFCEAGGTDYNPRSPKIVVDEITECINSYGIKEIDIFDYDFTIDKNRVIEICNLIIEKRLDVSWACRSRIDIDNKLLPLMKNAGCTRIYFGIESGSQKILNKIEKGITLAQIQQTIKNTKKIGIKTLGFFLIGAPGDTIKTVKKTVKFAKSLDLDYVQFSKCLAKPLTPLWKDMTSLNGADYWKEWVLGKETDRALPRPWTELSNEQIDRLTKWAYISYHSRPFFLFKALLKMRSFDEVKRKACAFFDMLFNQESFSKEDKDFAAYHEKHKKPE